LQRNNRKTGIAGCPFFNTRFQNIRTKKDNLLITNNKTITC